jgi:hypothetical protein
MSLTEILTGFGVLIGFGTAVFGAYRYMDLRDRELRWKRIEFIFEQAKYMDNDPEIHKTVLILSGIDESKTLDEIFSLDGEYLEGVDSVTIAGFEKLFNLLDRISYVYNSGAITKAELANFGLYFSEIIRKNRVVVFCEQNGYQDVVKIAQEI